MAKVDQMEHFHTSEWVDFAHNHCDPAQRDRMNAHLAEGCQSCSEELAAWTQLVAFSIRESDYTPPHDVVRMVKNALPAWDAKSAVARVREVAELVFDSFRAPQTQGV